MKYGIFTFSTDDAIRPDVLAQEVERRGFESLWFPEHSHIPVRRETPWGGRRDAPPLPDYYRRTNDAFVALAYAAAVTSELRLGTGVTLVAQRDPAETASKVSSLDTLSNGRMIFGIGYGWNKEEMAQHGVEYSERRMAVREHVLEMKAIWSGRIQHGDGAASAASDSVRVHPPIVMGARLGPRTIQDIVEFCDGWFPLAPGSEIRDDIRWLRDAFEAAGRDEDELQVTVGSVKPEQADVLERAGVDRVLFTLSPSGEGAVRAELDRLAIAASL